jgi:aminopeptidase N
VARRLRALVALSLIALSGCSSAPRPKVTASSPAAPPSPSVAASDFSAWQAGRSAPVPDPVYPKYGNPSVDVLHYGLDLTWAPDTKTLTGQATLHLRTTADVTAIALDFSAAYTIDGATVDGTATTAAVADGKFTVPATLSKGRDTTLVVKYHGTPKTVPMPSNRGDAEPLGLTVTDDGGLWTMQEPYGSATWYPSNDQPSDKALYDIAVTVPPGWSGVASGTPKGQDGNTFRYSSTDPVATYLTTLAVGRYQKETATGPRGLPIEYWFRPGVDDAMMKVVRKSPGHLAWLEQRFGPYPFATAGVVLVPSVSAMETQQMVTLGAKLMEAGASADDVEADVLHEYAHQWFGNTVTPSHWKDLWLNEGWATYIQALYTNERDKISASRWEQFARQSDARLRSSLGPPGSPKADRFAEGNVYLCPALMLHQIHKQLGDNAFFALGRDWAQRHKGSTQDRATFIAFVNQHTGKDFTALINTWLDSPTTPR